MDGNTEGVSRDGQMALFKEYRPSSFYLETAFCTRDRKKVQLWLWDLLTRYVAVIEMATY